MIFKPVEKYDGILFDESFPCGAQIKGYINYVGGIHVNIWKDPGDFENEVEPFCLYLNEGAVDQVVKLLRDLRRKNKARLK